MQTVLRRCRAMLTSSARCLMLSGERNDVFNLFVFRLWYVVLSDGWPHLHRASVLAIAVMACPQFQG